MYSPPQYEIDCGDDPQIDMEHDPPCVVITAMPVYEVPLVEPPPFVIPRPGIREASMRHDVLARKKYYKPFKSFKFNRARRQSP